MARIWARSLRARVTLIATAVAAIVLIPVGVAGVAVARYVVTASVWKETRDAASVVTGQIRGGDIVGNDITVRDPSVDLIQIVTPARQIVAATPAAQNLPPLSDVWPSADQRVISITNCLEVGCLHITGIRVSTSPESVVVYAARQTPGVLSTRLLEIIVGTQVALLIGLASWATWLVTGRALRPVAAMRTQLDAVNASDMGSRVSQPPGDDEVAQLARSINGTLARLERSAEQQRQFASDASHELRTPLAGLRAQLESAQLYPEDTDVETLADSALRDTDRVEAIITDLLLLARIGSRVDVVKEPVNLAELVDEGLAGRKDKIPVRLELGEGAVVEGVRFQLDRMLANLLDNAQRHADSMIDLRVGVEDGQAVLALENDGAPIDGEDRERIFERFTRLDAARSRDAGGTGLGLAIARDVAVAHGGTLSVADSERGACFVLRLPLAAS